MSITDKITIIDRELDALMKLINDTREMQYATTSDKVIKYTYQAFERLALARDVYKSKIEKYNENLTPEDIAEIKSTELRQLHVVTGIRRRLYSTDKETYEYIDLKTAL